MIKTRRASDIISYCWIHALTETVGTTQLLDDQRSVKAIIGQPVELSYRASVYVCVCECAHARGCVFGQRRKLVAADSIRRSDIRCAGTQQYHRATHDAQTALPDVRSADRRTDRREYA